MVSATVSIAFSWELRNECPIDKKLINEIFTSISAVRSSVNQIAQRINSTGRVYDEDMKKIADMHEVLNRVSSQLVIVL